MKYVSRAYEKSFDGFPKKTLLDQEDKFGERIKNMQDSGIIRGFTAIIDAKAYEKFASVYMDIEAEPMKINDVAKELMKLNEIAIVSQHTGSTGLHVHAYIDSVDKVSKYLEENIALKKSKEDIPVTGMAVLRQQYTLAEAIEEWIASLKKEINS